MGEELQLYRAEQSDKVVYWDWLEKLKKELEVIYGQSPATERRALLTRKQDERDAGHPLGTLMRAVRVCKFGDTPGGI